MMKALRHYCKDEWVAMYVSRWLKAGIMAEREYVETSAGTPQGGVLSPLLTNVYLDKLDQFVEETLMPKYNRGQERQENPDYRKHLNAKWQAKQNGDREKWVYHDKLSKTVPSGDPFDPNYRRLRYVRYADDFLLGYEGTRQEAEEIKQELQKFLSETLKLELSNEKTLITHARKGKARFC